MARCSICHTLISALDKSTQCTECHQDYHAVCWSQLGGCATYGCQKAVPPEKPAAPEQIPTGWGDHKVCPACEREIGSGVLLCYCGARFPHADPMTAEEFGDWRRTQRQISGTRSTLAWLFILSLFGFPAPVLGPIAGAVAYSRRDLIAGSNGTYLAMGYGAAALGGTYAAMILLLSFGL